MTQDETYDPLRCYVAVYRYGGEIHLSGRTFSGQKSAWTIPTGPNVPRDMEILEVIEVRHTPVSNGD